MVNRHPSMTDRDWELAGIDRPFAVNIDGIWRLAFGVYVYPFNAPLKVNVNYNGRIVTITGTNRFVDLHGCSETEMEYDVIVRNISSFPNPKPLRKKIPNMTRPRTVRNAEGIVAEVRLGAQPAHRVDWFIINETPPAAINPTNNR